MNLHDVQVPFADQQPALVPASSTVLPAALARTAGVLVQSAMILGLPITFSLVPEGGEPGQPVPQVQAALTGGNAYWRYSASPFLDPAATAAMAAHGRKTLVIAGFSAEVAVLHAALDAIDRGYEVYLPVDAVGARSGRTECAAFRQIERAGGTMTSVASLVTRLAPDFSQAPGSLTFKALAALRGGA